jgi:hypothetical protein
MFCPKCGAESQESQKFCKSCGTNLQVVSDALGGGQDSLGHLSIDVESLKQSAINFAKDLKAGRFNKDFTKDFKMAFSGFEAYSNPRRTNPALREQHHAMREKERALKRQERAIKQQVREEIKMRNLPRPKEWLAYSWQHNLKNGLISLFSGAGFAVVWYYLGQFIVAEGLLRNIPNLPPAYIGPSERLLTFLWIFAAIPVLKGVAQIIYAAFFAESIATLAERFTAPPPRQDVQQTMNFENLAEPPSSVTEHTTRIFHGAETEKG